MDRRGELDGEVIVVDGEEEQDQGPDEPIHDEVVPDRVLKNLNS